ncbi:mitochondrial genome maintenance exonuclease 1-like [Schistocerca gregaria]|uniref:mitochondrial genome maintenance exonuclease 1-like n=1 Tax=Schistocerca gregaria TaxID=7010 RepID=UPI00211EADCF|nr:mitochondrial genome maintenance exonuclease 1-like [Schistocerca gregaria]
MMLTRKLLSKLRPVARNGYELHTSVSYKKKVSREVGEAIKRLNKENKSLFGELLETRSQKRVNVKRNKNLFENAQEDKKKNSATGELQWTLTRSTKNITKLRQLSNPQIQIIVRKASNHVQKTETPPTAAKPKLTTVSEPDSKVTEDIEGLLPKFDDSNVPPLPSVTENCKKHTLLHLPDNVLKSIPSFPLFNNKKIEELSTCGSEKAIAENAWKSEYYKYPAVSRILNATMSEKSRVALRRWQQRMIAELGQEGFMDLYTGQLSQGEEFHTAVCSYLSGIPESDLALKSEAAEGCWHSVRHSVLQDIKAASLLEQPVVHPQLRYQGIADCVACYKGKPVLIEWKKSDKRKSCIERTYDAPLQVCAYMGALSFDPRHAHLQVQGGLIVVAYSDGSPANFFMLSVDDCQKYWQQWLARLQQYWLRNKEVVENAVLAAAE